MAQISDKIVVHIKKFVREALIDNIRISQAVLFGSYAKGTNHE
jgi:predicted nucleotidyltransferase